ncbi:MAG: hypothetical protein SOY43_08895 [Parabacteroides sp.]|nr:hypothetical protein [bacterium]MDY4102976.1 hypothetical protein [Parabacteroides sp.]
MKKIFTSISLAALSFLAATPMSAQQQVTAEQAGAFVEAVIPAMLDQVKTISGLDVKALLAGEESGFHTTTAIPPLAIQPDSAHLNVMNILTLAGKADKLENFKGMLAGMGVNLEALPIYFSEYTTLTMDQPASMQIEMPGVISSTSGMGGVAFKIDVTPAQNAASAIPFSSLKLDLELSGLLANLGSLPIPGMPDLSWLKSGNVLSMEQKTDKDITTTTVTLGGLGMALNVMMNGEEAAGLKSLIIITDPTQVADKGYIKKTTKLGLATVDTQIAVSEDYIYNLKQSMPLVADSVVTLYFDDYGQAIESYTKKTYEVGAKSSADGDCIYKTVTEYAKDTNEDEWVMVDKETTEMAAATPLDPNDITRTAIAKVMEGLAMAGEESDDIFEVTQYAWNGSELVHDQFISVEAQKKDDSLVSIITIDEPVNDDVTEDAEEIEINRVMAVVTTLAKDGGKTDIIIPVQNSIEYGLNMGTLFFQTNLLQFVTANEAIAPVSDVTINVAENGIYVNNCEKGRYSIVSINGKVVANGIISGEGAFIATPGLQRGQVYIIAVEENGVVKAIKFVK